MVQILGSHHMQSHIIPSRRPSYTRQTLARKHGAHVGILMSPRTTAPLTLLSPAWSLVVQGVSKVDVGCA